LLSWAFTRLSRYAERQRESLPVSPRQVESTRQRLAELARRGFLVSAESLLEDIRRKALAPPPPIASIGITTRNRTGVLRRGLASYVANRLRYGRSNDYLVIDDAGSPGLEAETRGVLASLQREFDVPIRYAGCAERRSFAARLAQESGLKQDLVQFALFGLPECPVTTGAARNCLLLATAGGCFAMVDDDSMCRMVPCPEGEDGIQLTSQRDPGEFWFFPDTQSTLRAAAFEEADFLGLHERLLGRGIGACLPEAGGLDAVDLSQAKPAFDRCLRVGNGRIRATMAGILGDSGIGATAYLFVDPRSQRRLTRSEADYLAAVRSRQVLRCVRRVTVSEGTSCVAVNLGLDNRALLPPFIPVQRNSDGLFARTLRLCSRDAYLGYLPWAVLHDPERPRQQDLDAYWQAAGQMRLPDLLVHLLQASGAPYDGFGEAASLRRLGAQLEAWGRLDAAGFDEVVREQAWKAFAAVLSPEAKSEIAPAEREFYAAYRRKYAGILRERLTQADYLTPVDLRPAGDNQQPGDNEQAARLSREIVRRFGELLQAWPELYAAAQRLRARDVQLAPSLRADC
jgi:hypothetical protein